MQRLFLRALATLVAPFAYINLKDQPISAWVHRWGIIVHLF